MAMIQNTYRVGIVLILLSLVLVGLRLTFQKTPEVNSSDWQVTVVVQVDTSDTGAILSIFPPWDSKVYQVIRQTLYHPGGQLLRSRSGEQDARRIAIRFSENSSNIFIAEFDLRPPAIYGTGRNVDIQLSDKQHERWLTYEEGALDNLLAARALELSEIIDTSARLRAVLDLFAEHSALVKKNTNKKLHDLIAFARLAGLPARSVSGIVLVPNDNADIFQWVEIFNGSRWVPVDPDNAIGAGVPPKWIPMRKSGDKVAEITTGAIKTVLSVNQLMFTPRKDKLEVMPLSSILDLTRLSVRERESLGLLLLLPFGALLNTICRSLGGIQTFGIFTAPLLAVSVVSADWVETIIIFVVVFTVGIAGRAMLPEQRYARFSRLTLVFTIVALVMPLAVSAMEYYGATVSGYVVLLPIVVLTSLIDRVYSYIDEKGLRPALNRLVLTLIVASGCYLIFIQEGLARWIIAYPETHMATAGVVVILSAYKGRSLFERLNRKADSTGITTQQ